MFAEVIIAIPPLSRRAPIVAQRGPGVVGVGFDSSSTLGLMLAPKSPPTVGPWTRADLYGGDLAA
jgi:hypothetical protein